MSPRISTATRVDLQKWSGIEFLMSEGYKTSPIAARGAGICFVRSPANQKRSLGERELVEQDRFLEGCSRVVQTHASILRLMFYWPASLRRSQSWRTWLDGWIASGLYDFENEEPVFSPNEIPEETVVAFRDLRDSIMKRPSGGGADRVRDPGNDPEAPRDLHHLGDGELLEIVLGKAAAKRLLAAAGNLQLLAQWSLPELVNRGGLPEKKARALHAALVAGKRGFTAPMPSDWSINSPADVARFMTQKIGHDRRREHFVVLLVDSSNRLIRYVELSQGTINATLVHPRDVLAAAIQDHAVGIIVGHNHPSGQAVPSPEDKALTNRLGQAAQAVGIGLRDHVIVTPDGRFYSFADHGEMPSQNPRAVF